MSKVLSVLTFLLFSMASLSAQSPQEDADFPITRVTLYKHGLGYFERIGSVDGVSEVSLRFRKEQMSDVLQTLTVLDLDGGKVSAIAYESQKPPEMVLKEFAFDIGTDDVEQSLLKQLRGARVSIEVAGREPLSGAVLGLELRKVASDGAVVPAPRLTLVTDDGEIVGADLYDLRSLKFEDRKLADEVLRYLSVLRSTHRPDEKTVDLALSGVGERKIFASYAVEQPVWKATYRLVLGEEDEGPLLQGWAVVDNVSDEDWTDVDLSLVSGLPVSFRHDLYTPRYRARPELRVEEQAVMNLDSFGTYAFKRKSVERLREAEVEELESLGYVGRPGGDARESLADGAKFGGRSKARRFSMDEEMRQQGASSVAREVGDLLEYRIDHPVTIPRNRSALIPIVSGNVSGGRVSLYDEYARPENPMSAVRMVNTTGLTLEGGPVTVLEVGTYAGESFIDSVKPDDTRYVAFAVDLGIRATTEIDSSDERVSRIKINRGTMVQTIEQVMKKTYTFDNRDDEERNIVIEHPRRAGFELKSPDEPYEETLDVFRFKVDVSAKEQASVAVLEVREISRNFSIGNVNHETIQVFQSQGILNSDALELMELVIAMKAEIQEIEASLQSRRDSLSAIDRNQTRIRKNLTALGSSPEEKDLRRAYVDQLTAEEARVGELQVEAEGLEKARQEKKLELDGLLSTAVLEYEIG